ncbi:MAG TPA: histidinol-phosphate transaminase [Actinopolymorphaceae bacterium]|jgi:histidinol-phosphate aminotransferase
MRVAPRPWLELVDAYVPGEHAADADGSLASNESFMGASPAVQDAVARAVRTAHRYPDPLATSLREELAVEHGVSAEQILVGNGSDELIYLLAWAFAAHGGRVVCADPCYRIDETSALVAGAKVTKVPLVDWCHDLEAMARHEGDIAYVVNPHNPTGTSVRRSELAAFVDSCRAKLPVIDEAYVDFADDPASTTAMPLAAAGKAVVLRTFSKLHGLAGLRVGYLVGPPDVIAVLRRIRAPFSVNALAQAAAMAALRDKAHRAAVHAVTVRNRSRLVQLLEAAGLVCLPSQANFVLAITPDEDGLLEELRRAGVSARPGSALGVAGAVRITVPTETGLQRIAAALEAFRSKGQAHAAEPCRSASRGSPAT